MINFNNDLHSAESENREQGLVAIGQWAIDTCLLFGCRPETAWQIAAVFVTGLREEIRKEKKAIIEMWEKEKS